MTFRCWICLVVLFWTAGLPAQPASNPIVNGAGWPTYGGDPGGQRYSLATQITPANVAQLRPAWVFHTRALAIASASRSSAAFEATPILQGRTLYLSSPFDTILAVDAVTGQERWRFDPKVTVEASSGVLTSRGVAYWQQTDTSSTLPCAQRVFVATLDARLIAVDAATGRACAGFGQNGTVDLKAGVPTQAAHPFQGFGVTSPPTVVGDVVVVGSAVIDNQTVDVEPGIVRAYDARTGALRWTWDPLAGQHFRQRVGGGNTWGAISADPEHGIVYLPTGSLSPDFYGGGRPGNDVDADSLVALEASSGRKLWAFQTVHHDLWDYDVAAQPLLFDLQGVPAVAVATKTGMLYVLNRLTGAPLTPVQEAAVSASDVEGEQASGTQPRSGLPGLAPTEFVPRPAGVGSAAGDAECAAKLRPLRYQGMFTPPSLQGTLLFPGSLGGVNWGSGAFDPETGTFYANTNRLPFEVRLVPRTKGQLEQIAHDPPWYYGVGSALMLAGLLLWLKRRRGIGGVVLLATVGLLVVGLGIYIEAHPFIPGGNLAHFGVEISEQRGTPFWIYRAPLADAEGLPCVAPPWGALTAVDVEGRRKVFEVPVGTMRNAMQTGTVGLGGPMVTKGGLVFTGTSRQPVLRAFDKRTGAELWEGKLPVPAQSTPMTYVLDGKQYVVVAAGGHGGFGTTQGDALVAFALP